MRKNIFITKILIFTFIVSTSLSAASVNQGALNWARTQKLNISSVEQMIEALKSNDPFVRVEAVQALGESRDLGAIEPLVPALKDNNLYVRAYSAEALGKLRDSRAVQPLINALNDKDVFVQAHVVKALGEMRNLEAVNPLIALLDGKNEEIKPHSAWALGEIKDTGAVGSLIKALKVEICCDEAAMALRKITKQDFGIDFEQWNEWWVNTNQTQEGI